MSLVLHQILLIHSTVIFSGNHDHRDDK